MHADGAVCVGPRARQPGPHRRGLAQRAAIERGWFHATSWLTDSDRMLPRRVKIAFRWRRAAHGAACRAAPPVPGCGGRPAARHTLPQNTTRPVRRASCWRAVRRLSASEVVREQLQQLASWSIADTHLIVVRVTVRCTCVAESQLCAECRAIRSMRRGGGQLPNMRTSLQ